MTENALDYLILAGEQVKHGTPRLVKHAVATLADGIELLLKARIEQRDWCLIFADIDKAQKQKYSTGDFVSVTFRQAVIRLDKICGVTIDKTSLEIIGELRQARNRVRHFTINVSQNVAMSLLAKAFSFALDFYSEHLEDRERGFEGELDQLRRLLGESEEYVQKRMMIVQPLIDAHKFSNFLTCPACLQETMSADGEGVHCYFCELKLDGESAAEYWINRFNLGGSMKDEMIEPTIRQCPECHSESCIPVDHLNQGMGSHYCMTCGENGEYQDCITCGELCSVDSLGDICYECREHYESV